MDLRDHSPIALNTFNGLWRRGDETNTPLDHFIDCNNIIYTPGGFQTRPGMTIAEFGDSEVTIPNVRRMYIYNRDAGQSLLVLDNNGNIFHTGSPTPLTAILTIAEMTDFDVAIVAERAYITPSDGRTGLEDEFLYVYLGDGTPARKAAGEPPTGTAMIGANGSTLDVKLEAGTYVVAVIYITDTGFRTKPGPVDAFTIFQATGAHMLDLSNIPVSPDTFVVARQIVISKPINNVEWADNPDPDDYELFILPSGLIDNNIDTTLSDIDFFPAELLESASPLIDLMSEIAAGVALTTYRDRLVLNTQYGEFNADPELDTSYLLSTVWISNKGEPEAFNEVNGLVTTPQDGYPLTRCQEYRDILYVFKEIRTYSYNDNGEEPATWPLTVLDQGSGCSVHGVATVMDSGGINVDFLLLINFNGIMVFTGTYIKPELTWKIETDWLLLDRTEFKEMQLVNSSVRKRMYCVLPNNKLLYGDYSEGLDNMKIKWAYWNFTEPLVLTTLALKEIDELALGFMSIT